MIEQFSIPGIERTTLNRRNVLISLAAFWSVSATSILEADGLIASAGNDPTWTASQPPFRIAGNIHYVGSRELASYLITTSEGHVLINSNLETSPPQIRTSVEKLGFKFSDIKILLINHAHFDHCAGSAEILKQSGARYMVMDADVADVESGGRTNFQYANRKSMLYPPAKVTKVLHDRDQIRLGNATLTAIKTPGHTRGCTTWTMQVKDERLQEATAAKSGQASPATKTCDVVIVGSPYVLSSYDLLHSPRYPTMAADFDHQFRTLESLPCDIFLGAHGAYFGMFAKYARLKAGDAAAFVDPQGYRQFVAQAKTSFESELRKQQTRKRP